MDQQPVSIASWLLRSKVTPPRQLLTVIDRRSLARRLSEAATGNLIILEAPGGYGKSSLLAAWREERVQAGEKICWLSVDEDDDPDIFIAYLAFAAHIAGVDMSSSGLLNIDNAAASGNSQSIYRLLAQFERVEAPVRIILDDFERLSEATKSAVLPVLLRRLPQNCTLIVASREPAGINTVDIEHRGLVSKFGAHELRFTLQELAELWKGRLTERQIKRLEAQTDGWPVLVRLLLSSAELGGFDIRQIEEVSRGDSSITSYFEQKILSRLDSKVRDLLLAASIFESFSDEMLTEILDVPPDDETVAEIHEMETFIAPLAGDAGGMRLHPMMREYLSHKFAEAEPERFRRTNVKAARWYSRHKKHVPAVRHAIACADRNVLDEILEATGGLRAWLQEGLIEFKAINRLISDEDALRSPTAGLIRVIILMKSGRQADASALYRTLIERHSAVIGRNANLGAAAVACRIMLSIYQGLRIGDKDIAAFEEGLAVHGDAVEAYEGFALTVKCVAAHQAGNFKESLAIAERAIAHFKERGSAYGECYIHLHKAMVAGFLADDKPAAAAFADARAIIRSDLSGDEAIKPVYEILEIEQFHEGDPLDSKWTQKTSNVLRDLLKGEGWVDIYAAAFRTMSEKLFVGSGFDAAAAALKTFREYAVRNDMPYLTDICDFQNVILHSWRGEKDAALGALDAISGRFGRIDEYFANAPWRAAEALSEALLSGRSDEPPADMIANIRAFRDQHFIAGNLRTTCRLSAALALFPGGVPDFEILAAAFDERFARSVAFIADDIRAIQIAVSKGGASSPVLALIDSLKRTKKQRSVGVGVEPSLLSTREARVLAELAKGKSDKQIALALGITEHGVHYHLKNIFVKLGAQNRVDALQRAQSLGLNHEA